MATLESSSINVTLESGPEIQVILTGDVNLESIISNGAEGKSAYTIWLEQPEQQNKPVEELTPQAFLDYLKADAVFAEAIELKDINNNYISNNVESALAEIAETMRLIADKHFTAQRTYEVGQPVTDWVISHNMNKYPSVRIYDDQGHEVIGNIIFNNLNQVTLSFSAGFTGVAYLN